MPVPVVWDETSLPTVAAVAAIDLVLLASVSTYGGWAALDRVPLRTGRT